MRQEKQINLRWTPRSPATASGGFAPWVCRTLSGGAILAGTLGILCTGPESGLGIVWALGFGVYLLLSALFHTRFRLPGLCLSAGALLGVSLAAPGMLRAGLASLANFWLQQLSVRQGKIYLPFAADPAALVPALTAAACLFALLTAWGAQRKPWILLIPLTCVTAGCISELWSGMWLLLALLGLLSLWLTVRGALWQRGVAAALSAAVLLALCLPGLEVLSGPEATVRETLAAAVHRIRYESGASSMPEGRLNQLGPWNKSGQTALELTMQAPQKLYLRGYVGECYTSHGWTALPPENLAGQQDLFYWLHKQDFFSQTSLAQAGQLAGLGEEAELTVTVDHACRRWSYLPYGLSSSEILETDRYPDGTTALQSRTYTVSCQTGSLARWYQSQGVLAGLTGDGGYLTLEAAYRDFVYDAYLQLPEATVQAIGQLMQDEETSMTLPEIQTRIRTYLDEAMEYDETVTTQNGGVDFLAYVLMAQGRGYSVHYATIATCLLRYYGVPARYVEGYYLPADQAENLEPGAAVRLDESYAHAWAEFYLDGVGWIPFEVTPGYLDGEEATLQGLLADPDSALHQALSQTYETQQYRVPQAFVQQPEPEAPGGEDRTLSLPWQLLWLIPLMLVLAMCIRCICLRCKLRRRLRSLEASPVPEAVAGLYAYCRSLWLLTGLPASAAPDWESQAQANREALFSRHPMTEVQRQAAVEFLHQVRTCCKTRLPWHRRLYLRWIRCVY